MKIVCDSNMPYVAEAFGTLGEVYLQDGRLISAAEVAEAEVLITRSTTKVNAELLDGSRVRFYGSGVIGTDHIAIPWLEERGIVWSGAPGCNAESVANYVSAALLWLAGRAGFELRGKVLGVVGAGNVGRRVVRHAAALGMEVLVCDPPRKRDRGDIEAQSFVELEQIVEEADIVTLHVPLTREGEDATWHMLNRERMGRLKQGAVLVNAARGGIVDNQALLEALGGRVAHAVLDCWEGEPDYCLELQRRVEIATPHIAGHSFEGKVNGTAIVYRKACEFFGVEPTFDFALPPPPVSELRVDVRGRSSEDVLREAVMRVCDIEGDSERFKGAGGGECERRQEFDRQRGSYPMRREFASTRVWLEGGSGELRRQLADLGFQVEV